MKTRIIPILVTLLLLGCGANNPETTPTKTPENNSRFPFITDVNRYSEVMESITPKAVVEHFPESIPSEASNVKFAYQPRIMQGAMFLELLMVLPEEQVTEIWDKYSGLEKYQFIEDKTLNDIPEPNLFLINNENHEAGQNFSIFLVSAEPAGTEDFIWNHGTMYGVGINKTTFQVIYWLEYW
ncbi:MAG TPA: hypothetical protein DHW49_14285 [Anaerolineae bacterium]|nr:hypothetical protein [Anaerolineae bacterium]